MRRNLPPQLLVAVSLGLAVALSTRADDPLPSSPGQSAAQDDATGDARAIFRPALLREGSFLVQSRGAIERNPMDASWEYVITPDEAAASSASMPASAPRRFILHPNSLLSEIIQIGEAAPADQGMFEITGEVFVYRGRNYLLPTHAPRLVSVESPQPPTSAPASAPASSPSAASSQPADQPPSAVADDSVDDIKRRVREAVGSLPAGTPVASSGESVASSASDQSTRTAAQASSADAPRIMREGATLVNRRGRITRDPHGAWLFVFEADASGLADPPMVVLPCLLLERLETYSGRLGPDARMLITGRVTTFASQNYLLPTAYTIPRERTKINP